MSIAAEKVTIEFEFTREDYLRLAAMRQERSRGDPRWQNFHKWQYARAVMAAIFVVAGGALAAAKWREVIDGQNMILGLFICCMFAAAAGSWWQWAEYRKRYGAAAIQALHERWADSEGARQWQGIKRVTLSPPFFTWESRQGIFMLRWSGVRAVARSAAFIEIDSGGGQHWPVPLSAFATPEAADAFTTLAKRYKDAAPPGVLAELAELLRDRDFACPGCGYNLRGNEEGKCPECGRPVQIGEVLKGRG